MQDAAGAGEAGPAVATVSRAETGPSSRPIRDEIKALVEGLIAELAP